MSRTFTKEAAASALQCAFAPFRCSVETYDCGAKARVRVVAPDDTLLLNAHNITIQRLQTVEGLSSIVALSRRRIANKGYEMVPWHQPLDIDT